MPEEYYENEHLYEREPSYMAARKIAMFFLKIYFGITQHTAAAGACLESDRTENSDPAEEVWKFSKRWESSSNFAVIISIYKNEKDWKASSIEIHHED